MNGYLDDRRHRAVQALGLTDEILVVGAGEPIPIPGGADQCHPFATHPHYRWLTDSNRAGGVIVFDPESGWTHFVHPTTTDERIWEGGSDVPSGYPISELQTWLDVRKGRKVGMVGCLVPGVTADRDTTTHVELQLTYARRAKDDVEIELLRRAAAATARGFERARSAICAGVSERELAAELEYGFRMGGGDANPGYSTIVGIGTNSSVLHFAPSERRAEMGEVVLIDAGAKVSGYVCDITRTYCVGEFRGAALALHDLMVEVETNAVARCRPGVEWLSCHRAAALDIAKGLVHLDILKCSAESAVESGAIGLFFPHGLGHLVGLGVRDAAGTYPSRNTDQRIAGVRVRIDMPLEVGFCVTVEPGVYFIKALLEDESRTGPYRDMVNWDALAPYIAVGGVRIEDDILITSNGHENLTSGVPK